MIESFSVLRIRSRHFWRADTFQPSSGSGLRFTGYESNPRGKSDPNPCLNETRAGYNCNFLCLLPPPFLFFTTSLLFSPAGIPPGPYFVCIIYTPRNIGTKWPEAGPQLTLILCLATQVFFMVLMLFGHSEIGAQVRSNLFYLICLRHLIRSIVVTNQLFLLFQKDFFSSMRILFSI